MRCSQHRSSTYRAFHRLFVLAAFALCVAHTPGNAQQSVRLGAALSSSPSQFVQPVAIRELSDGSVLIADQGDNLLLHYSFDTSQSRMIGRVGGGPGEYRTVGWLHPLGTDTTLFTDRYTGRWLLLAGTKVVRTFPEQEPLNLLLSGVLDGASRDGHVMTARPHVYAYGARRFPSNADTLALILANWRTGVADTLSPLLGRGAKGYTVFQATAARPLHIFPGNPLSSQEQALLFSDGWIAIARLRPYRVDWRSPTGRWVRGSALPSYAERAPTMRDKCAAITYFAGRSFPCEPTSWNGWPDVVPAFAPATVRKIPMLLADAQGNAVIARTRTAEHTTARYDVVDRTGAFKVSLTLGPSEEIIGFSERYMYVARSDEDDLFAIRRHARLW